MFCRNIAIALFHGNAHFLKLLLETFVSRILNLFVNLPYDEFSYTILLYTLITSQTQKQPKQNALTGFFYFCS